MPIIIENGSVSQIDPRSSVLFDGQPTNALKWYWSSLLGAVVPETSCDGIAANKILALATGTPQTLISAGGGGYYFIKYLTFNVSVANDIIVQANSGTIFRTFLQANTPLFIPYPGNGVQELDSTAVTFQILTAVADTYWGIGYGRDA